MTQVRDAKIAVGRSGGAGWCVAMQNATAVWARRGCCAVGVEDQGPAPSVHDDQVVERAEQTAVAHRCFAAFGAGPQVMNVTADRRQVAAREPAMLIPAGDR